MTGPLESAESTIGTLVLWLRLAVETVGAATIALGVVAGAIRFFRSTLRADPERYDSVRITLAQYLALALEFQLAADVLSTAIAPSWDKIGKLGAIAAIRTVLNFFLSREVHELRKASRREVAGD